MDKRERQRLLKKLCDGKRKVVVNECEAGYLINGEGDQTVYSIDSDLFVEINHDIGMGFGKFVDWISGACHELNFNDFYFTDEFEAVEVMVAYFWVYTLLQNVRGRKDPNLPQILQLQNNISDFFDSRYIENPVSKVNIRADLERFRLSDYISDENLRELINGLDQTKSIPEVINEKVAIKEFKRQQNEQKLEAFKQKLSPLTEKFYKFKNYRKQKKLENLAENLNELMNGGEEVEQ